MLEHEDVLKHYIKNAELVGSFRRRAETSGDIDVLIRVPTETTPKEAKKQLAEVVKKLKESKYIIEVLALGEHKCMAICRTAESAMPRRLDLLMIPEHQYGSALLYFTGSDRFNVAFRQHALHKGYTLNEYGLTPLHSEARPVPALPSEKDLFHFLGLEYVEPWERTTMLLKLKARPPIIHVAAK
jgi:DNA polymerase beta